LRINELQTRLGQLGADHDRERATDDEHREAEKQVQRADVLVVGGQQPALDKTLLVGVVVVRIGDGVRGSHGLPLGFVWCKRRHGDQLAAATAAVAEDSGVDSGFSSGAAGSGVTGAAAGAGFCDASHCWNSSFGTALTTIGMKPCSLPQSSAHWPR